MVYTRRVPLSKVPPRLDLTRCTPIRVVLWPVLFLPRTRMALPRAVTSLVPTPLSALTLIMECRPVPLVLIVFPRRVVVPCVSSPPAILLVPPRRLRIPCRPDRFSVTITRSPYIGTAAETAALTPLMTARLVPRTTPTRGVARKAIMSTWLRLLSCPVKWLSPDPKPPSIRVRTVLLSVVVLVLSVGSRPVPKLVSVPPLVSMATPSLWHRRVPRAHTALHTETLVMSPVRVDRRAATRRRTVLPPGSLDMVGTRLSALVMLNWSTELALVKPVVWKLRCLYVSPRIVGAPNRPSSALFPSG